MTCASCVAHVAHGLEEVPGVAEAQVNLATENATVTFGDGPVPLTTLVQAVQGTGYDVATEKISLPIGGVTDVVALTPNPPAQGEGGEGLLRWAASVEVGSEHPLGKAIARYAEEQGIALGDLSDFEAIRGKGVRGTVDGDGSQP